MIATDTTSHQATPTRQSKGRLAFNILLWVLVLALFGIAWLMLLAHVAPARLNVSSVDAALFASTPPFLLTLLLWTGMQRFSTVPRSAAVPSPAAAPTAPAEPHAPLVRFRIGAWSALTPHGSARETVDGTKARTKMFKPDKEMPHPSGYPAHAAMISSLTLEAMAHPAHMRRRAPRAMAMLCVVLDDLHAQQGRLVESIPGPANVYWMVPPAMYAGDDAHAAIFAAAWERSAWRDSPYLLNMSSAGAASFFNVLSVLQEEIDQSSIPYTLLVAADSLLDREELALAMARGQVFSHTSPQGFIPSEGAAGILLFNPGKCSDELWASGAIVEPVRSVQREGSDIGLSGVMSAALAASGLGAAEVSVVVSDSDHRTRGSMEVVGAMRQVFATLDPLEQRISPMEHAGAFGAAADLVNFVLAAELAAEKPVITISTEGEQLAAVVLRPA